MLLVNYLYLSYTKLRKRGGIKNDSISTTNSNFTHIQEPVSKWEKGEAIPDIDKLVQLAEIFGVSLDYLVLGKEPEKEIVVEQKGKMNAWEFLSEY